MKVLLLACLLGAVGALPHSNFFSHYRQNPVYNKPISYAYMQDPMATMYLRSGPSRPMSYHHGSHQGEVGDHHEVMAAAPAHMFNYNKYMMGEQFFKHDTGYEHRHEEEDDSEILPYTVVQNYGPYEEREYPSVKFACVKTEVDNSQDPFAGLRNVSPLMMMSSKRWRKHPSSIMFKELFKYISGVNKGNTEVEMTAPVSTHHSIKKKQFGGDLEVQEMCFYIPAEHQESPPEPLDTSPVYIFERPAMSVYAYRFPGWALTADRWAQERQVLETLLIGKPHHDKEYYTNGYDSPFVMHNRRNEVWIQKLEPSVPVIAAVVAEEDEDAVSFEDTAVEDENVAPKEEEKVAEQKE